MYSSQQMARAPEWASIVSKDDRRIFTLKPVGSGAIMISRWVRTNVDYGRSLLVAGYDGAVSTRQQALRGEPVATMLTRSAGHSWMPAVVGACAGALGTQFSNKQKSMNGLTVVGALLGAAVGFCTGLAWNTRHVTGTLAQAAVKATGPVRDAHWLARNPVNYG
jgi:hypothetical protein